MSFKNAAKKWALLLKKANKKLGALQQFSEKALLTGCGRGEKQRAGFENRSSVS